jgi:hypothetical protein
VSRHTHYTICAPQLTRGPVYWIAVDRTSEERVHGEVAGGRRTSRQLRQCFGQYPTLPEAQEVIDSVLRARAAYRGRREGLSIAKAQLRTDEQHHIAQILTGAPHE